MSDTVRTSRDELWVCHLGLVPYADGVALQERCARAPGGRVPDTLLLLEHPPVYTRGRRSAAEELPLPARTSTRAEGSRCIDTDRGGRDHLPRPRPARRLSDHGASPTSIALPAHDGARDRRGARRGGRQARARASRTGPTTPACGSGSARSPRSACTSRAACRTHGFAVNVENDLEPFSLGRRLRPARRADDLARARDRRRAARRLACFRKRMAVPLLRGARRAPAPRHARRASASTRSPAPAAACSRCAA